MEKNIKLLEFEKMDISELIDNISKEIVIFEAKLSENNGTDDEWLAYLVEAKRKSLEMLHNRLDEINKEIASLSKQAQPGSN